MASSNQIDGWSDALPGVELEVRHDRARGAAYALDGVDFLIGTVPGCDLRVVAEARGRGDSAVLCLIARHPGGASLRKLASTQIILVNGANTTHCDLADGDRVQIGPVEIIVHITAAATPIAPDLDRARQQLQESVRQFRLKVQAFQHEKEAFERAKHHAARSPSGAGDAQRGQLLAEIQESKNLLEERALEIERQKKELTKTRQEMADLRRQLHEHYAERRDSLDSMNEDIEASKHTLGERVRKLQLDEQDASHRRLRDRQRHDELERKSVDFVQRVNHFGEERRLFEERQQRALDDWAQKHADLQEREDDLTEKMRDVEEKIKQYEVDVLKLHHRDVSIAEREAGLKKQQDELARQREQLLHDTQEFEEQVAQIDQWRTQMTEEAERFAKQKEEQDALVRQANERVTSFEGQQASLAVLRGRLERLRDELRVREQKIDEDRDALAKREVEIAAKEQAFAKKRLDMEADEKQYADDRQQWLERGAKMEAAVRQLKLAQESVQTENERLRKEAQELHERRRQFDEAEALMRSRLAQLAETQERIDLDRKSHQERSMNLVEREQACVALQEQLHQRSQEIARKHQEISVLLNEHGDKINHVEQQRLDLEQREQTFKQQADTWRAEFERKAEIIQKQHAEVVGFDEKYKTQLNHLAAERKAQADERAVFQREQQASLDKIVQARRELEAARADSILLIEQMPDAELRAGTAVDRLGHAREQLRGHLTEVHGYVRQCQEELEQLRNRLQEDLMKLGVQEKLLRQNQDEHRLAVAAFRQELIDWQGQIAELRRLLSQDETRLERKQAKVEQRAKAMDEAHQRLAEHAESLQEQQRDVDERRTEIDRHLGDMQAWYRGKLRELAGVPLTSAPIEAPPPIEMTDAEGSIVPTGRNILSITGSADPGDQKLGEVLRELQLIDADTLTALLAEARRQRRSLRQVLLASGVITLYQLALIEAGNVSGLVLGPVRIIDRVRHNALETVYRVFDPRRGVEAVLRHLSEANMSDTARPDEFRASFRQAMLNDPRLANTLEVLELSDRPAALQEWLTGLPATDWPALAAAPGVCYRLLTQAAQGLASAHQAGVVHGHLTDANLLLTADGVLKICGLGEPAWLVGVMHDEAPTVRDDLRALGRIASSWCTPSGVRKGAKTKPLPEALVSILYRMAADGDAGYANVVELLSELQKAADVIPANAEAWDRLLKYVRENGAAEATLRQSA